MRLERRSPRDPARPRGAPRIGAPPLIALGGALLLLALLVAVMLVPGAARSAGAETTSSTDAAPTTTDGAPQDTTPSDTTPSEAIPTDPTPAQPSPGRLLVTLPWGQGTGQVGLVRPAEGLTRGPEALAIAPDGRIAVLDSVNKRVVALAADGSPSGQIPLDLREPRFLAVDGDSIYVLDADADRRLVALDWQGVEHHDAAMPALDDVVTGLFATTDGPCVEVAHDAVYLVDFKDAGQTGGAAKQSRAALRAAPGRPLDLELTRAVKATFDPKEGVKLKRYKVDKKTLKGTQIQALAPKLSDKAIEHLISLDGDGQGGIILGARLLRAKGDPVDAPALIIGRLAADQGGADPAAVDPVLADTITLSDSPFAYLGEPYAVAPDGRVFQPVGDDTGYSIYVYTLPGAGAPAATAPVRQVSFGTGKYENDVLLKVEDPGFAVSFRR